MGRTSEERRRLDVSTGLFARATGLSRIVGLARESLAGALLGQTGAASAFVVANNVPNLIRSLVADAALGASFVPVFNDLLQRGERERAWRVASTVITLTTLALAVVSALGMLLMRPLLGGAEALFRVTLTAEQLDLATTLGRILFPIVLLLGVSGIVNAILNSFDEFYVPAIAPVFWNLVIAGFLVAGLFVTDDLERRAIYYAVGTLVGTVVQFLLPLPWLRGRGGRLRPSFAHRDPAVRRVLVLMLPVALGLGLVNVSLFAATFYAVRLGEWAPRAIESAFRLYMLPQGIFSVAIASVLFPTLARHVAEGDLDAFRDTIASGIRQIAFLLLPASAVCIALAEPLARLVYERGEWTAADSRRTGAALAAFAIGLAANGVILLLNRAFFSLQQPWTPTLVSLGTVVITVVLFVVLAPRYGATGVVLGIALSNLVAVPALLVALRGRIGGLRLRATIASVVRSIVCSAILGGVAYATFRGLDGVFGRSTVAQMVVVGTSLLYGGGVYLALAAIVEAPELALVKRLVRR